MAKSGKVAESKSNIAAFHSGTLQLCNFVTFTILTNIYLVAILGSMTELETIVLTEMPSAGDCCATDADACCSLPPSLRFAAEEAERIAGLFKAIGHPVRLQIMDILARFGRKVCVCDIESQFNLTQPTISHHLKTLRQAGVIDFEVRGLWAYYFIKPGQIEQVRALLDEWNSHAAVV